MTPAEIRELRQQLGYTQAQLATACGVTPRAVRWWEAGKRTPTGSAQVVLSILRDNARGDRV